MMIFTRDCGNILLKMVELLELVQKLSNWKEASGSHGVGCSKDSGSEVKNLHLLIAAKDQELHKSKQKHAELEVANAQLQELQDDTT